MEPAWQERTPDDAGSDDPVRFDGGPPRSARRVPWDRLPAFLVALGVGLLASLADRWLVGGAAPPLRSVDTLMTVATTLPFVLSFVYGGYRLRRSSLPVDRYRRIGYWCGGGLAGFLGLNLVMIATWWPGSVLAAIGWTRFAAAAGGGGGLLFGVIEARAIERERRAERSEVRAEMVEDQQQWFDYMNSLLRHEILNTANVLTGNASLLLERGDLDEEAERRLETIQRHCRDMELVIRDVRVLIDANNGNAEVRPIDLAEVIDAEVGNLEDSHDDVTVDVDVPERLPVVGDELLGRVFSNLLSNAVKHNDGGSPHVRVTARTTGERVVCRVGDDGPGVPDQKREILFEREHDGCTDHGLGLYLVRTLLDRYGGCVELTRTGPTGSVFTVELQRATGAGPADSSADSPDHGSDTADDGTDETDDSAVDTDDGSGYTDNGTDDSSDPVGLPT